MRTIWELTLREKGNGYRVTIKGNDRCVQGEGYTPSRAYLEATEQLVIKPAFFLPFPETSVSVTPTTKDAS